MVAKRALDVVCGHVKKTEPLLTNATQCLGTEDHAGALQRRSAAV